MSTLTKTSPCYVVLGADGTAVGYYADANTAAHRGTLLLSAMDAAAANAPAEVLIYTHQDIQTTAGIMRNDVTVRFLSPSTRLQSSGAILIDAYGGMFSRFKVYGGSLSSPGKEFVISIDAAPTVPADVLLDGITFTGDLEISDCAGAIRFRDCTTSGDIKIIEDGVTGVRCDIENSSFGSANWQGDSTINANRLTITGALTIGDNGGQTPPTLTLRDSKVGSWIDPTGAGPYAINIEGTLTSDSNDAVYTPAFRGRAV